MPLCANMSNICQRKWKCRLTFKEKTDILLEKVLKLFVLSEQAFRKIQSSIYIYTLLVCLSESNKCQNGWTDRIQTLCGTSCNPRAGLWMLRITKNCIQNLLNFGEIIWMRTKIFRNSLFCFCFTNCTKSQCTEWSFS